MASNASSLVHLCLVMGCWHLAVAAPQVYGMCGKIEANRVWDVQWSGSPNATEDRASSFALPYISGKGRLAVEPDDYFTLTKNATGEFHQLKHYGKDGSLKTMFPEGVVKANSDSVFYIVDGWHGTLITKEGHKIGDAVTLSNMTINPSSSYVEGACVLSVQTSICGKIKANRVWDVQWSGSPNATEDRASSFRLPYILGKGRLAVEADDYFTLTKNATGEFHQLKHYGKNGSLKTMFPEGVVKANSDSVFYIVDGWYATLITKEGHKIGDAVTLSNMTINPSVSYVEGACSMIAGTTTVTTTAGTLTSSVRPGTAEAAPHLLPSVLLFFAVSMSGI